jgi:hypothetical protein
MDENETKELSSYYKNVESEGRTILIIITLISLFIWTIGLYNIWDSLASLDKKTKYYMYKATILTYLIGFFSLIQVLYRQFTDDYPLSYNLGPEYRTCNIGSTGLTNNEKATGAIGYINFSCLIDVFKNITQYGDKLRNGAYYVIYTLFALLLFITTNKNIKSLKNNYVLLTMVRFVFICSLLTIASSSFSGHGLISIFIQNFGSSTSFMMSLSTVLVLFYIVLFFV